MSERESTSSRKTDKLVEKIHEIQEEIFELEDEIDDLVECGDAQESLVAAVEQGQTERRNLHLERLRADWDRMVERSREVSDDRDFELAAALVHFVGEVLASQSEGTDARWVARLREYLEEQRMLVN